MSRTILISLLFLVLLTNCSHELEFESAQFPHVFTESVSNISTVGFKVKGEFADFGATKIDSYGFVVAFFDPTLFRNDGQVVFDDQAPEFFEHEFEFKLRPNNLYVVRAFAK